MNSVAEIITTDEFNPTPEDEAWAVREFNGHSGELAPRTVPAVPVNGQPTSFVEYVDDEARSYRSQRTPEALFIAGHLERLAQLIRWTGATTPAEHTDRMDVWDAEIREQHFDRGYSEGYAVARRELSPFKPE